MALPCPPRFWRSEEGWRHRAAAYVPEPNIPRGWYQDGRELRHVKASKAFIWPKDGKNRTAWGRMKDIVQNKGPDIYVAFGARKEDCVSNKPSRAQWSKYVNLDDRGMTYGFNSQKFSPWIKRSPHLQYDFRTRQYRTPDRTMWTDAIWRQEPYKNRKWNNYPEAYRDGNGRWWQDVQHVPQFRGGPIGDESGRGLPHLHFPYGPGLQW